MLGTTKREELLKRLPDLSSTARGARLSGLARIAFLGTCAAGLTLSARAVFPVWDDGYLWLHEAAGGADAIRLAQGDRPILGALWGFLSLHGALWEAGTVVHWIAWLGIGLVTFVLWSLLFLARSELAIVAASLSLASLLCETQLILVVLVWLG